MSYLHGQLDARGCPVTRVTVGPGPHAQIHTQIHTDLTAEVNRVGVAGAVIALGPVRIEIPSTGRSFAPFDLAAAGIQPSTLGADVLLARRPAGNGTCGGTAGAGGHGRTGERHGSFLRTILVLLYSVYAVARD